MAKQRTPSLLEPESRGGDEGQRGFDFQGNFLVSQIPRWLGRDGFVGLLHESVGDIEVKMYTPGHGETIEMIEAKNYRLTPAVFWAEIERFYTVDQGSPNTFSWFRLVSPDISPELVPLQNGLRRIRSPYGFYPENSGVVANSLADFCQLVAAAEKPPEYADFLYRRVLIETEYATAQDHGEALFRQNLGECLLEYSHLSYQVVSTIYSALLKLVAPRNTLITRESIEETIRACVPPDHLRPYAPVGLHTTYQPEDIERKELVLDWIRFSGGGSRVYPETEEWNVGVVTPLVEVRQFVLDHRSTRHVRITGGRRLSAALAIGSVLSATNGFTVAMEQRDGAWWHTNDHAGADDAVPMKIELPRGEHEALIVSIGIPHDIQRAVENYAQKAMLSHLPLLNVACTQPIENARQANSIVAQTKTAILESLSTTKASHIHLFCATPSFVALLLGHRLNATASVQCYEYVASDSYVPTCLLNNK